MINTKLLKSLDGLLRDKQTLRERTNKLAKAEQRLIGDLSRALSGAGYRVVRVDDRLVRAARSASAANGGPAAKTLRCPKCPRLFSHPLPMARHVAAAHQAKRATKKAAPRRKRKVA